MERTVLMIRTDQRKRLTAIAKKEKVSLAEINRRAIDQYLSLSSEEMKLLNILGDKLEESNKHAEEKISAIEKALEEFLKTGK